MGIRTHRHGAAAFTLLEMLVSMAILLIGIIPIVFLLPNTLSARREASLKTRAAVLAQRKAEEIRRDNDIIGTVTTVIRMRTEPTDPMVFPEDGDLAYAFWGRSLLYTASPQGDPNVPRVIIVRADRPAGPIRAKDVVYEHRFDY